MEDLKKNIAKGVGTSGMFTIELHSTSTSNNWMLDTRFGSHICSHVQGLSRSRKIRFWNPELIMGNKIKVAVTSH